MAGDSTNSLTSPLDDDGQETVNSTPPSKLPRGSKKQINWRPFQQDTCHA